MKDAVPDTLEARDGVNRRMATTLIVAIISIASVAVVWASRAKLANRYPVEVTGAVSQIHAPAGCQTSSIAIQPAKFVNRGELPATLTLISQNCTCNRVVHENQPVRVGDHVLLAPGRSALFYLPLSHERLIGTTDVAEASFRIDSKNQEARVVKISRVATGVELLTIRPPLGVINPATAEDHTSIQVDLLLATDHRPGQLSFPRSLQAIAPDQVQWRKDRLSDSYSLWRAKIQLPVDRLLLLMKDHSGSLTLEAAAFDSSGHPYLAAEGQWPYIPVDSAGLHFPKEILAITGDAIPSIQIRANDDKRFTIESVICPERIAMTAKIRSDEPSITQWIDLRFEGVPTSEDQEWLVISTTHPEGREFRIRIVP